MLKQFPNIKEYLLQQGRIFVQAVAVIAFVGVACYLYGMIPGPQ